MNVVCCLLFRFRLLFWLCLLGSERCISLYACIFIFWWLYYVWVLDCFCIGLLYNWLFGCGCFIYVVFKFMLCVIQVFNDLLFVVVGYLLDWCLNCYVCLIIVLCTFWFFSLLFLILWLFYIVAICESVIHGGLSLLCFGFLFSCFVLICYVVCYCLSFTFCCGFCFGVVYLLIVVLDLFVLQNRCLFWVCLFVFCLCWLCSYLMCLWIRCLCLLVMIVVLVIVFVVLSEW